MTIHHEMLAAAFVTAVVMGAFVAKTGFCTMGAVSDWVVMGDTGRLRAWGWAISVATMGVTLLEAGGMIIVGAETFPPYRTAEFAWLRHALGGVMFGAGMTLASGCGQKTLVRIGSGNLKSLLVLAIASGCAYSMLWTDFYAVAFHPWVANATIDLGRFGQTSQALGGLLGIGNAPAGVLVSLALAAWCVRSPDFRRNSDNVLGGTVVGVSVVAGWTLTGSSLGSEWKEWADFADTRPLRVATQSFTFVSPMGDLARYLADPGDFSLISFGIAGLVGVVAGSFLHAVAMRGLRLEWFASRSDMIHHAAGAVLMGVGGVLAMGCTVGQGITGVSTLALGSVLTLIAIVSGAVATMKYQSWRVARGA